MTMSPVGWLPRDWDQLRTLRLLILVWDYLYLFILHYRSSCIVLLLLVCVVYLAASAMDRDKSNTSLSSLSSDVKVLSSSPLRSVTTRKSSRGRRRSTPQVQYTTLYTVVFIHNISKCSSWSTAIAEYNLQTCWVCIFVPVFYSTRATFLT